jgi:hypothetical protein
MLYDVIIIGAGIAGLYAATRLRKKMGPHARILVLEKHKRRWLGGRADNEMFQGVSVVSGAGIGRKGKDRLLMRLLEEYRVPHSEFTISKQYARTIRDPVNTRAVIFHLRQTFEKDPRKWQGKSFKQFAVAVLGEQAYNSYMVCAEYTDYEHADVYETLYMYGLEDNESGWKGVKIPWDILIDKMAKNVDIQYSRDVTRVLPIASDYFIVETEDERRYDCVKVVVASTITSLRKLFPRHGVYKEIEGQSFLRLYGKFDKRSAEIMSREVPKMTIVPGPLRKMIPMGQGVYMIAYTDNKSAEQMKEYLTNTLENREILCRMMEKALGIEAKTLKMTAIRDYYWPVGTHYYKPRQYVDEPYGKFLVNAQHPMEGVTVVGEVVSKNHGWIEGALESVERGLRHF